MNDKNRINNHGRIVTIIRVLLIIVLLPVVIVYCIASGIKKLKVKKLAKEKIKIFNISQVDSMTGIEFECLLKDLFEKQGYTASLTSSSGDYGADLVCEKNGKTLIVQSKRYSGTVGPKAIQEIIGAKNHYRASDAMVVTNSYFSKEASILAAENDVKLVDRDVLKNLILKFDVYFNRTKFTYSCTKPEEILKIETRYKFWI